MPAGVFAAPLAEPAGRAPVLAVDAFALAPVLVTDGWPVADVCSVPEGGVVQPLSSMASKLN
ncbi:MAG: hypothetical protein ACOYMH_13230 [Zwartia sp.]